MLHIKPDFAAMRAATGKGSKAEAAKHDRVAAALCLHESITLPEIDPAWTQPNGLTLKGGDVALVYVLFVVFYPLMMAQGCRCSHADKKGMPSMQLYVRRMPETQKTTFALPAT